MMLSSPSIPRPFDRVLLSLLIDVLERYDDCSNCGEFLGYFVIYFNNTHSHSRDSVMLSVFHYLLDGPFKLNHQSYPDFKYSLSSSASSHCTTERTAFYGNDPLDWNAGCAHLLRIFTCSQEICWRFIIVSKLFLHLLVSSFSMIIMSIVPTFLLFDISSYEGLSVPL